MPTWKRAIFFCVFPLLSALSFISNAQDAGVRTADVVLGKPFHEFLRSVSAAEPEDRDSLIKEALDAIRSSGNALVTDSCVYFLYAGPAGSVVVPTDKNGWRPGEDGMTSLEGTDLFYLTLPLQRGARMEYKLIVDSVWMMDPVNSRKALGGYGYNSEVWMPGYMAPPEISERAGIERGSLDTLLFTSDTLGRAHPVFVYLPPGYSGESIAYETIWVTDGGEYLTLGHMKTVLDNMIHDRRIRPVVAIFVDPRTDPNDSRTSKRMEDYNLRSSFLNALIFELRPRILRQYRIESGPGVIMGASMGGLFSTYAVVSSPDVFYGSAAQSPAYWWDDGAIFALVKNCGPKTTKFYIDTGTISDAQAESNRMYHLLLELGCTVTYSEYPEGHNPVNWRARIDDILEYFFPASR